MTSSQEKKYMVCNEVGGWFELIGKGLLRKVLTGKSIFIVWRRCKGSLPCENEIGDLWVMRVWFN
jgi:hypothetical protein